MVVSNGSLRLESGESSRRVRSRDEFESTSFKLIYLYLVRPVHPRVHFSHPNVYPPAAPNAYTAAAEVHRERRVQLFSIGDHPDLPRVPIPVIDSGGPGG